MLRRVRLYKYCKKDNCCQKDLYPQEERGRSGSEEPSGSMSCGHWDDRATLNMPGSENAIAALRLTTKHIAFLLPGMVYYYA